MSDRSTVLDTRVAVPATGAGHPDAPPMDDSTPAHVAPQRPQFETSVWRSTQLVPQMERPGVVHAHRYEEHVEIPGGQAVPHAPQFIGSLASDTHVPAD